MKTVKIHTFYDYIAFLYVEWMTVARELERPVAHALEDEFNEFRSLDLKLKSLPYLEYKKYEKEINKKLKRHFPYLCELFVFREQFKDFIKEKESK